MPGCLKAGDIYCKAGGNVREGRCITYILGMVQLTSDFKETGCLRTAWLGMTECWNLQKSLETAAGRGLKLGAQLILGCMLARCLVQIMQSSVLR